MTYVSKLCQAKYKHFTAITKYSRLLLIVNVIESKINCLIKYIVKIIFFFYLLCFKQFDKTNRYNTFLS